MTKKDSSLDEDSVVGEGTKLGHYCVTEGPVHIGKECKLGNHVVLRGDIVVGDNTTFCDGAVIDDSSGNTRASVGSRTTFGHFCVIEGPARIGSDCRLGNHVVVRGNTVLEDGVTVGDGAIIESSVIGGGSFVGSLSKLREGTHIGRNSVFGSLSASEGQNSIGDHVTIETQCHITQKAVIEDEVFIATFFCGANTKRIKHGRGYPLVLEGYRIGYGSRIGVGVLVLPGVRIGREVLVGAGSLVTRDLPDFTVAYGHPAVVRRSVPLDERLKAPSKNAGA